MPNPRPDDDAELDVEPYAGTPAPHESPTACRLGFRFEGRLEELTNRKGRLLRAGRPAVVYVTGPLGGSMTVTDPERLRYEARRLEAVARLLEDAILDRPPAEVDRDATLDGGRYGAVLSIALIVEPGDTAAMDAIRTAAARISRPHADGGLELFDPATLGRELEAIPGVKRVGLDLVPGTGTTDELGVTATLTVDEAPPPELEAEEALDLPAGAEWPAPEVDDAGAQVVTDDAGRRLGSIRRPTRGVTDPELVAKLEASVEALRNARADCTPEHEESAPELEEVPEPVTPAPAYSPVPAGEADPFDCLPPVRAR